MLRKIKIAFFCEFWIKTSFVVLENKNSFDERYIQRKYLFLFQTMDRSQFFFKIQFLCWNKIVYWILYVYSRRTS